LPKQTHNARLLQAWLAITTVQVAPPSSTSSGHVIMNAVQAATSVPGPLVTVSSTIHGDTARIIVSDNGPGIPAAQRNQVFDPFFSTKKDSTGIGLGLAISQSIVTRIGGTLNFDADYSGGARFLITLPLAERGRE
jgi:C4-dicarboxylate-specific signal transduction histidine kinase